MSKQNLEVGEKKRALLVRMRMKRKKPSFVCEESWRYKRVKKRWRKPRGIDSKMRKKVKGWPKSVRIGYRGPKKVRKLHPSGYKEVLVCTIHDLSRIDPETQAIRIAHTVGDKQRLNILTRAKEKEIHILNPEELRRPETEEDKKAEEANEL